MFTGKRKGFVRKVSLFMAFVMATLVLPNAAAAFGGAMAADFALSDEDGAAVYLTVTPAAVVIDVERESTYISSEEDLQYFDITTPGALMVVIDGFTTTPMIAAGWAHTIALGADGFVRAWGYNGNGRLGDGTAGTRRHTPVQVQNLTAISSVAAGGGHSLALAHNGSVWAWGNNVTGQLGDGTTTRQLVPAQVQGLDGVTAISAGNGHSLALLHNGSVWAWGQNSFGQLGDGTLVNRYTPVQVQNLPSISAISAGRLFSLALADDGTVWLWGRLESAILNQVYRHTPVQVQNLPPISAISAGDDHGLALAHDGSVWAWGWNGGQLGDGTTIARHSAIQVQNLPVMSAVAAGGLHSLALANDGTVWTWGNNGRGQIADITANRQLTPIQIQGLVGINAIAAGHLHSVVLADNGTLWSWGDNSGGRLGDGTFVTRRTPVQVLGLGGIGYLNLGETIGGNQPQPPTPPPNQYQLIPAGYYRWALNRLAYETTPIRYGFYDYYEIIHETPRGTRIFVEYYLINTRGSKWYRASYIPGLGSGMFWIYSGNLVDLSGVQEYDPIRHLFLWYHSTDVTFRFHGETQSELAAMRRGMNSWNGLTRVHFDDDNNSGNIALTIYNCTEALASTWAGMHRPQEWDSFGPHMTSFKIYMNRNIIDALVQWDSRWLYHDGIGGHGFSHYDAFQSIFAHELGHAIGLNDNPLGYGSNGSVMTQGFGMSRTPTEFDIESVNMLWPPLETLPTELVIPTSNSIYDTDINITQISASYPFYENIYQLSDRATKILRVEVIEEHTKRLNTWLQEPPQDIDPYNIFTIYTLKVLESFYGNATPGDIIEVRQIGGRQDDEWLINTSEAPITVGDEAIMFMRASFIEGLPYLLLNPYQTVYHYAGNGIWEGAHPNNNLTLTSEDLEEIAADNNQNEPTASPPPTQSPQPTASPQPTPTPQSSSPSQLPPTTISPTQSPRQTSSPSPHQSLRPNRIPRPSSSPTPSPSPLATTQPSSPQHQPISLTPSPSALHLRLEIGSTTYLLNNVPHQGEQAPFIDPRHNRAMVPLRMISEALGAQVDWIESTRTVIVSLHGQTVSTLQIDTPLPGGMGVPMIVNDRTFVPITYLATMLGASVRWDDIARAVYIQYPATTSIAAIAPAPQATRPPRPKPRRR